MTAAPGDTLHRRDATAKPRPAAEVASHPDAVRRRELTVFASVMSALAVVYLLLLNPYWVPSGDGEVYLVIARNLVRGQGLMYNGLPVAIAPPGWPVILAGLMAISPTFLFLKLCQIAFMLAALGVSFFLLRRFVGPRTAGLGIFLAGILWSVYTLTYWMHSEAAFCLLAAVTMLLAARIGEGRGGWLSLVAVVLLSAACVTVRWTGVLQVLLVAAFAIGRGFGWRDLLRPDPRLLTAVLAVVFTAGSFYITRQSQTYTKEEKRAIIAAGGGSARDDEREAERQAARTAELEAGLDDDPLATADGVIGSALATTLPSTHPATQPTITEADIGDESKVVPMLPTGPVAGKSPMEEYRDRLIASGRWFSWLLWHPTRFVEKLGPQAELAVTLLGWLVIALVGVTVVRGVRRRQWFWPALVLYCGTLCLNWPNPNSRYLVPVAPFIIVGVLIGLRTMKQWPQAYVWRKAVSALVASFVVTVAVVNLMLWAVDMRVARSSDFYARYEAGTHAELISACRYIFENNLGGDRELAVSEKYQNMGKARFSKAGLRTTVLLTDRVVRPVPEDFAFEPGGAVDVVGWARRAGVRYYFWQEPYLLWRLWHFKLSPQLQEDLTGQPVTQIPEKDLALGGWRLYELERHRRWWRLRQVELDEADGWPTRVPGL